MEVQLTTESDLFYLALSRFNYINTWDNLLKKCWIGPNLCSLCLSDAESVNHLFTDYLFTKDGICGLSQLF